MTIEKLIWQKVSEPFSRRKRHTCNLEGASVWKGSSGWYATYQSTGGPRRNQYATSIHEAKRLIAQWAQEDGVLHDYSDLPSRT